MVQYLIRIVYMSNEFGYKNFKKYINMSKAGKSFIILCNPGMAKVR